MSLDRWQTLLEERYNTFAIILASTFYALVSVTVELTVYLTNFMQVNIVDPMTIVDKFSNILATPTIATGVNIKLILNNDL